MRPCRLDFFLGITDCRDILYFIFIKKQIIFSREVLNVSNCHSYRIKVLKETFLPRYYHSNTEVLFEKILHRIVHIITVAIQLIQYSSKIYLTCGWKYSEYIRILRLSKMILCVLYKHGLGVQSIIEFNLKSESWILISSDLNKNMFYCVPRIMSEYSSIMGS